MIVSRAVADNLAKASWIRRMFEEGARLKQERGADKVFDFTLGNPEIEPPPAVLAAARRVLDSDELHLHAYMPNAGHPRVREAVARRLRAATGLPYTANHVLMTVGAGAALNTVLKALLEPGRRGAHGGALLRRVRVLRREPRRAAGRRAAAGRPHARTSRSSRRPSRRARAPSSSTRRTIRAASSIRPRRSSRSRRLLGRDRPAHRPHQRRALPRPRLRRRDAARGAAAGHPHDRGHVLVQVAGHPRRAHRLSGLLAAHAGGGRAVRGLHLHQPGARLRERAGALAVGGGRGGRSGRSTSRPIGRSATSCTRG